MRGIFDDAYADPLGMAGSSPVFLLPSASVGSATHGSACVVGGVSYTVVAVQPDGVGMTRLVLQEA